MKTYLHSACAPRIAFITLITFGASFSANACPCGGIRVNIDNLAERSASSSSLFTLDVRYDYIDQNKRNGGAHAHILASHRNITSTLETRINGQVWSLSIPRIDRVLSTNIAPTAANPNPVNTSQGIVGIGDMVISTRVAWLGYTVIAGLKLPTGADDVSLTQARRYLQPGTGSTDLMFALRREYEATVEHPWFFWQFGIQGAIAFDPNFRPGTSISAAFGVRYAWTDELSFSVQTSALRQFRDKNTMYASGYAEYVEDLETAAFSTHIAAGVSYRIGANSVAYVYYSTPMKINNLADRPNGSEVNPVRASNIWTVGFVHSF